LSLRCTLYVLVLIRAINQSLTYCIAGTESVCCCGSGTGTCAGPYVWWCGCGSATAQLSNQPVNQLTPLGAAGPATSGSGGSGGTDYSGFKYVLIILINALASQSINQPRMYCTVGLDNIFWYESGTGTGAGPYVCVCDCGSAADFLVCRLINQSLHLGAASPAISGSVLVMVMSLLG